MSDNPESLPYKLTFGGDVVPIEASWATIARLTTEEYNEGVRRRFERLMVGDPSLIMQQIGLRNGAAQALVKHHEPQHGASLAPLVEWVTGNLESSTSLRQSKIEHLVAVFQLGVLVGRTEVGLIQQYAQQGIDDIERGE